MIATNWLHAGPVKSKSAKHAYDQFLLFAGNEKIRTVYTDGSKEFHLAFEQLGYCADTSTPYNSESNGIAERAVRKVTEGTSCTLAQSGWSPEWWVEAQNCFCFLYCVQEVMHNGYTPYQNKFERDFKGPIIPFGAQVEYKPTTPADKEKQHIFGS